MRGGGKVGVQDVARECALGRDGARAGSVTGTSSIGLYPQCLPAHGVLHQRFRRSSLRGCPWGALAVQRVQAAHGNNNLQRGHGEY